MNALTLRKRDMQALLEEHGLRLRRRHGQNFAIDPNFLDGIVREAEIASGDTVLEIGHGLGVLTARLAAVARHVVAVEVDAAFAGLAPKLVPEAANITWIHIDALGRGGGLAESIIAAIRPERRARLVSNLPYRIATAILFACLDREAGIDGGCVVVQREVAERWVAAPGTEAYGAASVGIQASARCDIVRRIPPEVFWPRPRVESALVRFASLPDRPDRGYAARLHALTSRLFSARRKRLGTALARLRGVGSRADAEALCRRAGLDPALRAETLSPEALLRLSDFFPKVG